MVYNKNKRFVSKLKWKLKLKTLNRHKLFKNDNNFELDMVFIKVMFLDKCFALNQQKQNNFIELWAVRHNTVFKSF